MPNGRPKIWRSVDTSSEDDDDDERNGQDNDNEQGNGDDGSDDDGDGDVSGSLKIVDILAIRAQISQRCNRECND